MNSLLAFREGLSRFYGKHDTFIRLLMKFLVGFGCFHTLNQYLGQMVPVNHLAVSVVLAAICMFLPSNSMILMAAAVAIIHFYAISLEAALAGGAMLVIAMLFYFSIAPESAIPAVLTALSLAAGFPGTLMVCLGLLAGPLSAVGVVYGVFFNRLVHITTRVGGNLQAESNEATEAIVQKMTALMKAVMADQEMILWMMVLVLTLWIVYLFRKIEMKYAWFTAGTVGMICYAAFKVGAGIFLAIEIPIISLILDAGIGLILALVIQILLFRLDYRKTERIQFEDDEYYYYVKAVPKRKNSVKKKVRRGERRR